MIKSGRRSLASLFGSGFEKFPICRNQGAVATTTTTATAMTTAMAMAEVLSFFFFIHDFDK